MHAHTHTRWIAITATCALGTCASWRSAAEPFGALRHRNVPHGFPVVTGQERVTPLEADLLEATYRPVAAVAPDGGWEPPPSDGQFSLF